MTSEKEKLEKIWQNIEDDSKLKDLLDPKTLRIMKLFFEFQKIILESQRLQLQQFIQASQQFQIQSMLQLQEAMYRLADELAKQRKESLAQQWAEAKAIMAELLQAFTGGFRFPISSPSTSLTSTPRKVEINIKESDEEPEEQETS